MWLQLVFDVKTPREQVECVYLFIFIPGYESLEVGFRTSCFPRRELFPSSLRWYLSTIFICLRGCFLILFTHVLPIFSFLRHDSLYYFSLLSVYCSLLPCPTTVTFSLHIRAERNPLIYTANLYSFFFKLSNRVRYCRLLPFSDSLSLPHHLCFAVVPYF